MPTNNTKSIIKKNLKCKLALEDSIELVQSYLELHKCQIQKAIDATKVENITYAMIKYRMNKNIDQRKSSIIHDEKQINDFSRAGRILCLVSQSW